MNRREPRWLDSQGDNQLPDALQRVLRSGELQDPSASQLARMRAQLGLAIGPAFSIAEHSGGNARAQGASRSTQFLSLAKPAGFATVLALGVATIWFARTPSARPAAGALPLMAATPEAVPATPTASVVSPLPEPTTAPSRDKPLEPSPARLQPSAAQPHPASEARPAKLRQHDPSLAEELRQLEIIHREVLRSPQRALAAARVHEQRFPHGALGPERELLRIEALLRLGQYQRARQLADRVLAAPAANPYHAQVADLLARYPQRADSPSQVGAATRSASQSR